MSYLSHMNLITRLTLIIALLLFPVVGFAQTFVSPPNQLNTFSAQQTFWGGTSITPGFLGINGLGGGGVGSGLFQVGATIISIINGVLVPVLFAVSFIVFLYGVAKSYIFSTGNEEDVKSGHKIILWGLIGFAVMISVWGLVNLTVSIFGLNNALGGVPSFFGKF